MCLSWAGSGVTSRDLIEYRGTGKRLSVRHGSSMPSWVRLPPSRRMSSVAPASE